MYEKIFFNKRNKEQFCVCNTYIYSFFINKKTNNGFFVRNKCQVQKELLLKKLYFCKKLIIKVPSH